MSTRCDSPLRPPSFAAAGRPPRLSLLSCLAAAFATVACACADTRARSPETEAALEEFYVAWEGEIRDAMADLGDDDIAQLEEIWPQAEFEGETVDVLREIARRPALRPFSRGLSRFLRTQPSNRVRGEMNTETVEVRIWKILIDTVNDELGRPTSTA